MYTFKEIIFDDGDKELVIDFGDKDKDILSIFLCSEVEEFEEDVLNTINKVISGESKYEKFIGNICRVEFYEEKTIISDIFDENKPYEINTLELKNLIEMWIKKLDEFYKGNNI